MKSLLEEMSTTIAVGIVIDNRSPYKYAIAGSCHGWNQPPIYIWYDPTLFCLVIRGFVESSRSGQRQAIKRALHNCWLFVRKRVALCCIAILGLGQPASQLPNRTLWGALLLVQTIEVKDSKDVWGHGYAPLYDNCYIELLRLFVYLLQELRVVIL